jgi:hypothetical protein
MDPTAKARLKESLQNVSNLTASASADYLENRDIPHVLGGFVGVKHTDNWRVRKNDGELGEYGPAIVFPIRDGDGKLVAAQGRKLSDKFFLTVGDRALGLFGTMCAFISEVCAVTEAPIDALTLGYAGVPTVAMCGSGGLPDWFMKERGKAARRDGMPVSRVTFIATDWDTTGEEAAAKLTEQLSAAGSRCVRLRPSCKDWNEVLTSKGLDALIEETEAVVWEALQVFPDKPDPRPDLPDQNEWLKLLKSARKCPAAHGLWHYLRCIGETL